MYVPYRSTAIASSPARYRPFASPHSTQVRRTRAREREVSSFYPAANTRARHAHSTLHTSSTTAIISVFLPAPHRHLSFIAEVLCVLVMLACMTKQNREEMKSSAVEREN